MNTIKIISRFSLAAICLLGTVPEMNGQLLKKLGKAAERAAERTVERRVEQETAEKTDQALDSIFEPGRTKTKERTRFRIQNRLAALKLTTRVQPQIRVQPISRM